MNISRAEIARQLGLSKARVTVLAQQGMPTDTVEAAAAWRREHLDPGRRKGGPMLDPMDAVERADEQLRAVLGEPTLERRHGAELAQTLRALPPWRRSDVALHLGCWRVLLGFDPPVEYDGDDYDGHLQPGVDWIALALGERE